MTCHAGLDEPVWTCVECRAALHAPCRDELARCPTIGCASWGPAPRIAIRPATPTPPPKPLTCWTILGAVFEVLVYLVFGLAA